MWYFSENGQQQGPVSLAELQAMIRSGRLTIDSLVWRQGMSDWMPVQGVPELRLEADLAKRGKAGMPTAPRPIGVSPPAGTPPEDTSRPTAGLPAGMSSTAQPFPSGANAGSAPAAPAGPAVDFHDDSTPRPLRPLASATGAGHCRKCGVLLPAENAGAGSDPGQGLCLTCRTAFAASLATPAVGGTAAAAAAMPSPVMYFQYGGFLSRFAACFCDGVILWLASLVISFVTNFGFTLAGSGLGDDAGEVVAFFGVLAGALVGGVLLPSVYYGYFLSTQGATPGKKLLGLAVIRPDGSGVSFVRGMCRYWATSLSGIICGIGYLMALFDDEKRALHDHLCDTRVVTTR